MRKIKVEKENQINFGPQPIGEIMQKANLKPHDLVEASAEQITHKMVTRACKGRKLSARVKLKIQNAVNIAADSQYTLKDLFNY